MKYLTIIITGLFILGTAHANESDLICSGGPFGKKTVVELKDSGEKDEMQDPIYVSKVNQGYTVMLSLTNSTAGSSKNITVSYKHNAITPEISASAKRFIVFKVSDTEIVCR